LLVPIPDLGLVAVVSGHDRSLRAERNPRLHALHVARERARRANATFVVTSPSPPLESVAGDVALIEPARRAQIRVEVARPRKGPVTPRLLEVVRWATAERSDVLVFAGRVGGILRLRCTDCGWYPRCERCGTSLGAEPADGGDLVCRLCGAGTAVPETCPACGGALAGRGWGHQRIAAALRREVTDAPVVTFVRDERPSVGPPGVVVVGTLAAAHDWPRPFAAICVADADQLLGRPDFRAGEYALQTLHELAATLAPGGRFLVQTREPEHHAVQAFTRRSFRYFAERELPLREQASYPPYGEIAVVEGAGAALETLTGPLRSAGAIVLGPVPGRRGSAKVLVRAPSVTPLLSPLRAFAVANPKSRIEIDPVDVV
jgi:primosomal protein N' (replication factor Y)